MKYSDLSPPITPYVELQIGDRTFNCMEYISSAEIEVIGDIQNAVSNAVLTVFDPDAIEIEKLLLKEDNAKLHFGLVDTTGKVYSSSFKGKVLRYIPSLWPEGVGITIYLTLESFSKLTSKDKSRSFRGEISDIVKQIAKENGLKAEVDKTDVSGVFRQLNQSDYDFLVNVLQKRAYSSKNDSPFFVWIEGDTLYFKQISTDKARYKFVLPDNGESDVPVVGFYPEFDFLVSGLAGDSVVVKKLNTQTKEYEEVVINNETQQKRPATGKYRSNKETKRVRVAAHGNSIYEEIARYKSLWGQLVDFGVMKATIELLGHPLIKPQEKVEVWVYVINNKTKKSELHYSSGIYQVMSVKHSISNGRYRTILELSRNGALKGSEETKGIQMR